MDFNANSTEIEKMDTSLKKLELTLDEEERLLSNNSGEEDSLSSPFVAVKALSKADTDKIVSLRNLKNRRNHERGRLRKLNFQTHLLKHRGADMKASQCNPTQSKDGGKVVAGGCSVSDKHPRAETSEPVKGFSSECVSSPVSDAIPAASKSSSAVERQNSQVPKRTRLAVNRAKLSTGMSKVAATAGTEALAVEGSNSKRNRSNNSSTAADVKRQRMAVSYCDAVQESLVMLVRRDDGLLTVDHTNSIREYLSCNMDSTTWGSTRPLFKSNKLIDGVFVFECVNVTSFDWLSKCLRTFVSSDGVKLSFNSKSQEIPRRKVVVYLPDKKQIDTQLLFTRLKGSNMELNFESWTLLRDLGESSRGRTLVFAADLASVQHILAKNCYLYYMLQMIYVEIRAPYEPRFNSRPGNIGECVNIADDAVVV